MKIKRFEFTTNIILLAFFAMTGAVMLVSAYGATCITWDEVNWLFRTYPAGPLAGTYMYPYIIDNLFIYRLSNIMTWAFGFVWGFVIYSFLTARKWAYISALISSVVGFVFGIIPALLSDTKGGTIPFEGIGSPHWGRTLLSLLTMGLLIIAYVLPGTRRGIKAFTAKENRMARALGTQLTYMSLFFFWLAFASFMGSEFMRGAHVVNGVNIWQTVQIQFMGGLVTTVIGSTMLSGGLILHFVKQAPKITKVIER